MGGCGDTTTMGLTLLLVLVAVVTVGTGLGLDSGLAGGVYTRGTVTVMGTMVVVVVGVEEGVTGEGAGVLGCCCGGTVILSS